MAYLTGSGSNASLRLKQRAFTLIELLVVLAILATLLTIAVPKYFGSVQKAKEAALKQDLFVLRDAIDKYASDQGEYPTDLKDLVTHKYIRSVPVDPFTESANSWKLIPPPYKDGDGDGETKAIYDVKSTAPGNSRDETPYSTW